LTEGFLRLATDEICGHFWPLFGQKIWPVATFIWPFEIFGDEKTGLWPLFLANWPLLKMKMASKKPSVFNGLRAFWPLSHFFFILV